MARRQHPMEAGERDRQVTIEQAAESKGTGNFPVETWTTLTTMFASKSDLRGTERFQADQLSARYDTRWEVSYRADLDPDVVDVPKTRRLVYRGRTFDIVDASMIGRKEGVELMTIASQKVN